MKNGLFLVVLLCIAVSLFASGDQESAPPQGEMTEELDVYAFVGPIKMPFWEAVVEEFNSRYPDVKVNMVGNAKIHDQIRPMVVAGDPPDVYFNAGAGRITVEQLFAEDLALPLDELLAEKDWSGTKTFGDTIFPYRMNVLEGDTMGIQLPFHLVGFFYHEPTFEANGWTIPENFAEFQELCEVIAADGVAPMTSTGKYPYYFEHFVLRGAVAAEGGAQALLDWKELKPGFFTSDVFKNVIKKYEWVIKNGYLLEGSEALNHVESQLEWINGNTAFVTSGTWIESEMSKDYPEGFKEGIRYLPSFFVDAGNEMAVVPYGDASIAVFKDGGNTAAAKEFVKALYSEKMMMKMTEITNILSNVPSANQKAAKSPAIESALGWLTNLNQVAWPEGGYVTQEITKNLQSLLQALMVGDETADSFCEKLEATAERIRNDSSVTFIDAYIPE